MGPSRAFRLVVVARTSLAAARGPASRATCNEGATISDRNNCGRCGNRCGGGDVGENSICVPGPCDVGATRDCATGQLGTQDVGPCPGGTQSCGATGMWDQTCTGQVVATGENCGNGVDGSCSGEADEDGDLDHDGFTTCGGDRCDSTECGQPALVNPGGFEVPNDFIDDDCDGVVDNAIAACDSGLASDSSDAMDDARAIDLCQTASEASPRWGVISATLTLADGTGR